MSQEILVLVQQNLAEWPQQLPLLPGPENATLEVALTAHGIDMHGHSMMASESTRLVNKKQDLPTLFVRTTACICSFAFNHSKLSTETSVLNDTR